MSEAKADSWPLPAERRERMAALAAALLVEDTAEQALIDELDLRDVVRSEVANALSEPEGTADVSAVFNSVLKSLETKA